MSSRERAIFVNVPSAWKKDAAAADCQKSHRLMWPFRPTRGERVFESVEAFFEDQCRRVPQFVREGEGRVAIVLDAREAVAAPVPIQVDEDGVQTAMLLVASRDGGFVVAARTLSAAGDPLVPGDLVYWEPIVLNDEISAAAADERAGLMGVIRGKLRPELAADDSLCVLSYYD